MEEPTNTMLWWSRFWDRDADGDLWILPSDDGWGWRMARVVGIDELRRLRAEAEHRCTYICPDTGQEVLAHRDERHVVIPAEEYRRLADALPRLERLARIEALISVVDQRADVLSIGRNIHGDPLAEIMGQRTGFLSGKGATIDEAIGALADALAAQESE